MPTGQDKIFRVVLDPSGIAPGGLLDLGPMRKDLVRKLNRVQNFFTLDSSALFSPYLAPGIVCHAISELVEKIPSHDHTPFNEVELNQREGKPVPRCRPYGAWTDSGGLEGRHGEVLGLELSEGHWKCPVCAQIFDRDQLDVPIGYTL